MQSPSAREITPPPGAYTLGSDELLRVWFANRRLNVVCGQFTDVAQIGLMLADLGRHATRAFADQHGIPAKRSMKAIRAKLAKVSAAATPHTDTDGVFVVTLEAAPFRQLPVPPAILSDPAAGEVIRIWRCGGKIEMVLMGIWDQPDNWGILLDDLCRLLAHAQNRPDMTAAAIRTWMIREWDFPTDPGTTARARKL
jgi:hypothetical protein